MKREIKTLKQVIDSFEEGTKVIREDILPDYKLMTWEEKLKLIERGHLYTKITLIKKDNRLMFFVNDKEFKRTGDKIFPCIYNIEKIIISNNKIYINKPSYPLSEIFLTSLGLENIIKDVKGPLQYYLTKPIIIKNILTGRIYNEETLIKRIISDVYHINSTTINWKSFKVLIMHNYAHRIYDLVAFTKNYYNSINILAKEFSNKAYDFFELNNKINILFDMLRYACELNEKIDFTWSNKRLIVEHQRQVEIFNKREIDKKDSKSIYEDVISTNNIKLLNTEKEIFMESTLMHHCLYRCYYERCKNKTYLAFHMKSPEDCTFGLKIVNGVVEIDQAYLKYDKHIQDNTRDIIQKFVEDNQSTLAKMLLYPSYSHDYEDPLY